jgi:autotransporter-associated beta strand protein
MMTFALTVRSDNRTWDGGGSDANWSTLANWDGDVSAPGTGDVLFFDGSTRLVNTNDLIADTSFAGLAFNSGAGAFALWGNRVVLDGNVTNWSASTQTLSLPMILSGTRDINASNGAVTVNGCLSGAGGLNACGYNTLTLTASNAYDGVTTVTQGTLAITHGNALGSTNANTVVVNSARGQLRLSGNITVAEPLALNGERPDYGTTVYNASGSNTLSGPVSKTHSVRLSNGSSAATLVIAGGFQQSSGTGGDVVLNMNGGKVIFRNTPLNFGSGYLYSDQSGLAVIAVAGNTWGGVRTAGGGTIRTDVTNALSATSYVYVGVWYNPGGVFDLNGFDQTIGALATDTANAGSRTVTSPTRATLTLNQNANTTFNGILAGAVCLVKGGTGQLILTNGMSTTTGDLIVSNGTFVIENSAGFSASTNVTVLGGTLELRTGTALSDSANLSIASGGAKVRIKTGLMETVSRLFLDGVPQAHGTYGAFGSGAAHTNSYFDGAGVLTVANGPAVTPTSYTWNAGGGSDTSLSAAANWEGALSPEFAGTSSVFFASGGSTATVNTNASLYGITFNRAGNFTLANGTGALTLGAGGILAASPSATTNTYTLAEDVALIEDQTWCVTNNSSGTTLTLSGNIGVGTDSVNITKTGNGTLVLSGSNTFDGVVSNGLGTITVSNPNALGSTAKGTVITAKSTLELTGNITLAEPLIFVGNTTVGTHFKSSSSSNTISGPIATGSVRFNSGSFLNIAGGVTGTPNSTFVINSGGIFAFTTTPINLGNNSTLWSDQSGTVVLGIASNMWGDTVIGNGTLRTDVANALPTNTVLKIGGMQNALTGKINLNGCDQTVAGLRRNESYASTIVVTSAVPATLTVNLNTAMAYDGQLDGALSLVKAGTGTLTLSNALSCTRGSIAVSNGTLVVTAASVLGNSTNVTVAAPVAGTSMLTLQTSAGIANAAALRIANGGAAKVSLAAGVNETVGWLYFGDKMMRAGTYSAASAQVIDTEHFAGTGVLTVLHDKSGTLIKLN